MDKTWLIRLVIDKAVLDKLELPGLERTSLAFLSEHAESIEFLGVFCFGRKKSGILRPRSALYLES